MRKKHYNSVEAIGLLLQGKKMCIEGHNSKTEMSCLKSEEFKEMFDEWKEK